MFKSNDSIKFMMAKIFLNLAEFSYEKINDATISKICGADIIIINYIEEGSGKVIINDEEFEINPSSYFVISQFSKYQIIPNDSIKYYSIYYTVDKSTAYKKFMYLLDKKYVGSDASLSYFFSTVLKELKNKQFGYNEIIVSMFKTIIVTILRSEKIQGERLSHWDLDNFQFQIDKIMQNEFQTITLDELAKRLYIGQRELQRYLLENYKMTFMQLKSEFRMSYASNLLLYFNKSIAEISDLVGYSSIEHFSNAFKKHYGISPLKYKKAYINKKRG